MTQKVAQLLGGLTRRKKHQRFKQWREFYFQIKLG